MGGAATRGPTAEIRNANFGPGCATKDNSELVHVLGQECPLTRRLHAEQAAPRASIVET
jgi:hypothetical protein